MTALPLLLVRTAHSEYLIDQEAGRFSRTTTHKDANPIDGFSAAEWHDYSEIYSGLTAGQRLVIVLPNGEWLRSTLVQAIAEVGAAA